MSLRAARFDLARALAEEFRLLWRCDGRLYQIATMEGQAVVLDPESEALAVRWASVDGRAEYTRRQDGSLRENHRSWCKVVLPWDAPATWRAEFEAMRAQLMGAPLAATT